MDLSDKLSPFGRRDGEKENVNVPDVTGERCRNQGEEKRFVEVEVVRLRAKLDKLNARRKICQQQEVLLKDFLRGLIRKLEEEQKDLNNMRWKVWSQIDDFVSEISSSVQKLAASENVVKQDDNAADEERGIIWQMQGRIEALERFKAHQLQKIRKLHTISGLINQ